MDSTTTIRLRSGNRMPVIGLGSWRLTDETPDIIATALKLGYRMIDTSGDYGTQPGVGVGIQKSGINREDLYLVTKVEDTEADAYDATQRNLKELQLEYANLILIHRPPGPKDPGLGLWEGLIQAKKDGLARDIGVSNYSIEQIQELVGATGETPAVNQIEWTPFGHSQEMLEYCKQESIIIQAYSPLTQGKRLQDATIQDLAALYRCSPAQILLRWCLQLGVVPIPKASKPEHMQDNLGIFDFELSPDDMATLNGLNEGFSAFGVPLPYS